MADEDKKFKLKVDVETALQKVDAQGLLNQLSAIDNKIEQTQKDAQKLNSTLDDMSKKKVSPNISIGQAKKQLRELQGLMDRIQNSPRSKVKNNQVFDLAKQIKATGKYENELNSMFENMSLKVDGTIAKGLDHMLAAYEKGGKQIGKIKFTPAEQTYSSQYLESATKEYKKEAKNLTQLTEKINQAMADGADMNTYMRLAQSADLAKGRLNELKSVLKDNTNLISQGKNAINSYNKAINQIRGAKVKIETKDEDTGRKKETTEEPKQVVQTTAAVPQATPEQLSIWRKLRNEADSASKSFENAHNALSDIYGIEKKINEEMDNMGVVDYAGKLTKLISDAGKIVKPELNPSTKKNQHLDYREQLKQYVTDMYNIGAFYKLGENSQIIDVSSAFKEYYYATTLGYKNTTQSQLNDMLDKAISSIKKEYSNTIKEYQDNIQHQKINQPDHYQKSQEKHQIEARRSELASNYDIAKTVQAEAFRKLNEYEQELESQGINILDIEKSITQEKEKQNKEGEELLRKFLRISQLEKAIDKTIGDAKRSQYSDDPEAIKNVNSAYTRVLETINKINELNVNPKVNAKKIQELQVYLAQAVKTYRQLADYSDIDISSAFKSWGLDGNAIDIFEKGLPDLNGLSEQLTQYRYQLIDKLKTDFPNVYDEWLNGSLYSGVEDEMKSHIFDNIQSEIKNIEDTTLAKYTSFLNSETEARNQNAEATKKETQAIAENTITKRGNLEYEYIAESETNNERAVKKNGKWNGLFLLRTGDDVGSEQNDKTFFSKGKFDVYDQNAQTVLKEGLTLKAAESFIEYLYNTYESQINKYQDKGMTFDALIKYDRTKETEMNKIWGFVDDFNSHPINAENADILKETLSSIRESVNIITEQIPTEILGSDFINQKVLNFGGNDYKIDDFINASGSTPMPEVNLIELLDQEAKFHMKNAEATEKEAEAKEHLAASNKKYTVNTPSFLQHTNDFYEKLELEGAVDERTTNKQWQKLVEENVKSRVNELKSLTSEDEYLRNQAEYTIQLFLAQLEQRNIPIPDFGKRVNEFLNKNNLLGRWTKLNDDYNNSDKLVEEYLQMYTQSHNDGKTWDKLFKLFGSEDEPTDRQFIVEAAKATVDEYEKSLQIIDAIDAKRKELHDNKQTYINDPDLNSSDKITAQERQVKYYEKELTLLKELNELGNQYNSIQIPDFMKTDIDKDVTRPQYRISSLNPHDSAPGIIASTEKYLTESKAKLQELTVAREAETKAEQEKAKAAQQAAEAEKQETKAIEEKTNAERTLTNHNIKLNETYKKAASNAHWVFNDDKGGAYERSAQLELDNFVDFLGQKYDMSKITDEQFDYLEKRILDFMNLTTDKYNDQAYRSGNNVSWAVAGPAKFNWDASEQKWIMQFKKYDEFTEKQEHLLNNTMRIMKRMIPIEQRVAEVRAGKWEYGESFNNYPPKEAVQLEQARHDFYQEEHEFYKDANAYFKKNKTFTGFEKMSDEQIRMYNNMMQGRTNVPFDLTTTRANMNRSKEMVDYYKKFANANPNDNIVKLFDGGKIVDNKTTGKIEIFFDEKPEKEVRQKLKSNGFRWRSTGESYTDENGSTQTKFAWQQKSSAFSKEKINSNLIDLFPNLREVTQSQNDAMAEAIEMREKETAAIEAQINAEEQAKDFRKSFISEKYSQSNAISNVNGDFIQKYQSQKIAEAKAIEEKKQAEQEKLTSTVRSTQFYGWNLRTATSSFIEEAQQEANSKMAELFKEFGEEAVLKEFERLIGNYSESKNTIDDIKSRITKIASTKNIKHDDIPVIAMEIDKRLESIAFKTDQSQQEAEEVTGLLFKIDKLFDQYGEQFGGIQGSGAKDKTEFRNWIMDSWKRSTGYDYNNIIDALYSSGFGPYMNATNGSRKRASMAENAKWIADRTTTASSYEADISSELAVLYEHTKANLKTIRAINQTQQKTTTGSNTETKSTTKQVSFFDNQTSDSLLREVEASQKLDAEHNKSVQSAEKMLFVQSQLENEAWARLQVEQQITTEQTKQRQLSTKKYTGKKKVEPGQIGFFDTDEKLNKEIAISQKNDTQQSQYNKELEKELKGISLKENLANLADSFIQMFNLPDKGVNSVKGELDKLFAKLVEANKSNNIEQYNQAINELCQLVQDRTKVMSRENEAYSEAIAYVEQYATRSKNGQAKSKVYVDPTTMSELNDITGDKYGTQSVLSTIFGQGNWTTGASKTQASISIDTIMSDLAEKINGAGNSTVDAILQLYNNIKNKNIEWTVLDEIQAAGIDLKQAITDTVNGVLKLNRSNSSEWTEILPAPKTSTSSEINDLSFFDGFKSSEGWAEEFTKQEQQAAKAAEETAKAKEKQAEAAEKAAEATEKQTQAENKLKGKANGEGGTVSHGIEGLPDGEEKEGIVLSMEDIQNRFKSEREGLLTADIVGKAEDIASQLVNEALWTLSNSENNKNSVIDFKDLSGEEDFKDRLTAFAEGFFKDSQFKFSSIKTNGLDTAIIKLVDEKTQRVLTQRYKLNIDKLEESLQDEDGEPIYSYDIESVFYHNAQKYEEIKNKIERKKEELTAKLDGFQAQAQEFGVSTEDAYNSLDNMLTTEDLKNAESKINVVRQKIDNAKKNLDSNNSLAKDTQMKEHLRTLEDDVAKFRDQVARVITDATGAKELNALIDEIEEAGENALNKEKNFDYRTSEYNRYISAVSRYKAKKDRYIEKQRLDDITKKAQDRNSLDGVKNILQNKYTKLQETSAKMKSIDVIGGDDTQLSNLYKQAQDIENKITKSMEDISNLNRQQMSDLTSQISTYMSISNAVQKYSENIKHAEEELDILTNKINNLGAAPGVSDLSTKLETLKKNLTVIKQSADIASLESGFTNFTAGKRSLKNEYQKKISSVEYKNYISGNKINNALDNLESKYGNASDAYFKLMNNSNVMKNLDKQIYKDVSEKYNKIFQDKTNLDNGTTQKNLNNIKAISSEVDTFVKSSKTVTEVLSNIDSFTKDIDLLELKIQKLGNVDGINQLNSSLDDLKTKLSALTSTNLDELKQKFNEFKHDKNILSQSIQARTDKQDVSIGEISKYQDILEASKSKIASTEFKSVFGIKDEDLARINQYIKAMEDAGKIFNDVNKTNSEKLIALNSWQSAKGNLDALMKNLTGYEGLIKSLSSPLDTLENKINKLGNVDGIDKLKAKLDELRNSVLKIANEPNLSEKSLLTNVFKESQAELEQDISMMQQFEKISSDVNKLSHKADQNSIYNVKEVDTAKSNIELLRSTLTEMSKDGITSQVRQDYVDFFNQIKSETDELVKLITSKQQQNRDEFNKARKVWGSSIKNINESNAGTSAKTLSDVINRMNAKDAEILKYQQKNSSGVYNPLIEQLKSDKTTIEAEIKGITTALENYYNNSSAKYEAGSRKISDVLFPENFDSTMTSNLLKFLNDARLQGSLTEKEFNKLYDSIIKISEIKLNGDKFKEQLLSPVNELNDKFLAFKKDINGPNSADNSWLSSDIWNTINGFQAAISQDQNLKIDDTNMSRLISNVEKYLEYGNYIEKIASKELDYFNGKTTYQPGINAVINKKDLTNNLKQLQKQQELLDAGRDALAANYGNKIGSSYITGYKQDDIKTTLNIAAWNEQTKAIQEFEVEMGNLTNIVTVTESTVDKAYSSMAKASAQINKSEMVQTQLQSNGISTDPNTASQPIADMMNKLNQLKDALKAGASQDLITQYSVELEQATKNAERLCNQAIKLKTEISSNSQVHNKDLILSNFNKDTGNNTQQYQSIKDQLNNYVNSFKETNTAFIKGMNINTNGTSSVDFSVWNEATQSLRTFRTELDATGTVMKTTETTIDRSFQNIANASKQMDSMETTLGKLQASGVSSAESVQKMRDTMSKLSSEISKGDHASQSEISKLVSQSQYDLSTVEKLYKQMLKVQQLEFNSNASGTMSNFSNQAAIQTSMTEAMNRYAQETANATISNEKFNKECTQMTFDMTAQNGTVQKCTVAIDSLRGKWALENQAASKATATVTQATGAYDRFKAVIGSTAKQLLTAVVGYNVFYKVIGEIRQGIGYVKEIDLAMTELKKVTDESAASYEKFLNVSYGSAGKVGATVSDFINATANFSRIGNYTLEQASKAAETAIVYKNVADGLNSIDDATDSIVSTMKAFGIQINDTMSIADKFNEVGIYCQNYIVIYG